MKVKLKNDEMYYRENHDSICNSINDKDLDEVYEFIEDFICKSDINCDCPSTTQVFETTKAQYFSFSLERRRFRSFHYFYNKFHKGSIPHLLFNYDKLYCCFLDLLDNKNREAYIEFTRSVHELDRIFKEFFSYVYGCHPEELISKEKELSKCLH